MFFCVDPDGRRSSRERERIKKKGERRETVHSRWRGPWMMRRALDGNASSSVVVVVDVETRQMNA